VPDDDCSQCAAPGEVMVPWNEPEVKNVPSPRGTTLCRRSTVKLPWALAMMDHPNIAQIFDAGATTKGRPYFVMEYIDGVPISQYCDRKRMTTRERLALFLAVSRAVQHAHQKGLIHRDLKPSNVLVTEQDGAPVPKVIDFGIAKATDKWAVENTLLTQFGQIVGTPEYLSPEQADTMTGDIDESSDVYSLGVLLYELLIGVVPFDKARLRNAGLAEMLRIIREEEAPSLSRKLTSMGAAGATFCPWKSRPAKGVISVILRTTRRRSGSSSGAGPCHCSTESWTDSGPSSYNMAALTISIG
jgi:serine/threonine protein kinase